LRKNISFTIIVLSNEIEVIMKVLVIGGAGYIGSHVVKELLKNNHKVTVFDNLSTGLRMNLFPQNDFIHGDILIPSEIEAAFSRGFDAFIHLAAFKAAGESMIKPEKYSVNNITGTLNIMNAAVKFNCLKMVFSSSAAVFGSPQYLPMDENHPKNPENYYGFTKLEIERFMAWYDQLKGMKFAVLRYFNAAGYDPEGIVHGLEQNPENLLPRVMEVAIGRKSGLKIFGTDYDTRDGTCIRDYVHVTDLASAHVLALKYLEENNKSLTVNLGTENGTTVSELIEAARRITGKEIKADNDERRPGDPACLYATSKYAKELLGWEPKYSDIDTLVKTTWDAYNR
jgi:UDP-glucose 4-epimerase